MNEQSFTKREKEYPGNLVMASEVVFELMY